VSVLGHWLLGDVEEGGDEAEGEDASGDAACDQSSLHIPTRGFAIHSLDFYQKSQSQFRLAMPNEVDIPGLTGCHHLDSSAAIEGTPERPQEP